MHQKQPPREHTLLLVSPLKIGGVDARVADKIVPFVLATHWCVLSFFFSFFFHTRSCKFEAEKSRDRHRLIKHRWGTIDFPAARLLLTLIVARLRFAFNATLPRLVGISSLMKERIRMNGWNKSCGGVKDVKRFWEVWKDEFWILKLLLLFQIRNLFNIYLDGIVIITWKFIEASLLYCEIHKFFFFDRKI